MTALNVKETNISTLNAADCKKLEMLDAKGCENLGEVNIKGCESLEYLDVSETAIVDLDVQDCVKLETLYCASCDIDKLSLEGCDNLKDINCSNNNLLMLNASELKNLRYLNCRNQHAVRPLSKIINFIDLLLSRGKFLFSMADDNEVDDEKISSYIKNVKNLKAYDEAEKETSAEYNSLSGEAKFGAVPSKITYDYDTGFENKLMDVEITTSGFEEDDDEAIADSISSGGCGGCSFGFRIEALMALMLLLFPVSKKKNSISRL